LRHPEKARAKGFLAVTAAPMTRPSFHADSVFAALREARRRVLWNDFEQQASA